MLKKILKPMLLSSGLLMALTVASSAEEIKLSQINVDTLLQSNSREMETLLKPFISQKITAELLQKIMNEVTRYYRNHGYPFSQAFIPEQTIVDGELTLTVESVELDNITVENNSGLRDSAVARLFGPIKRYEDRPYQNSEVESYLLKLNDLNMFGVEANFEPGTEPNTANMQVKLTKKPRVTLGLFADNHGNKPSGRYRMGGHIDFNNMTGNADRLSLFYAGTSERQHNFNLGYQIPVNSRGGVLGLDFCLTDYELAGAYRELGATGRSYTYNAFYHENLVRTKDMRFGMIGGLRYRDLTDRFRNFDLTFKKHTVSAYLGTELALRRNGFSMGWSMQGNVGKLMHDDPYDLFDDHMYFYLNSKFYGSYEIHQQVSMFLNSEFQLATQSLESSDQISPAGPNGVAAYDSSATAGDSGLLVQAGAEFKPMLQHDFYIKPHLDFGVAKLREFKAEQVRGAGMAISYKFGGFSLQLDADTCLGKLYDDADRAKVWLRVGYEYA